MYKTIWLIEDEKYKVEITQYHFGRTPKFPMWYFEEDVTYQIEMFLNVSVICTWKTFKKCLLKHWTIKERK